MSEILIAIVVMLKFVVPALMLRVPFYGLWANYLLDIVDGDILLQLGMTDQLYQRIDKFADLTSYVFMLIVGWNWRIRNTVAFLFFYRLIGQIIFLITQDERIFLVFINFLEPLMLIYVTLIFRLKSEEKAYEMYKRYFVHIWGFILAYKLWNEWYLHYENLDLSLLLFGFTGGR